MQRIILGAFVALILLLGVGTVAATEPATQTTATGVVTAYSLNVRDYPLYPNGSVIARVHRNEVYIVTGRSAINHWWRIQLPDGRQGWVNGTYITVYNSQVVPTIDPGPAPGTPQPQPTQSFGTVTAYHLNVRHIPDPINGSVIARVHRFEVYAVVGRNTAASWWQLRLNDGRTGWVNGNYLTVTNPQAVPITDGGAQPPATTTGTVTAYFLNVRNAPNPWTGQILAVIARGQVYTVTGRNSAASWWQIRLSDGRAGWVSGRYFSVPDGHLVPVTG